MKSFKKNIWLLLFVMFFALNSCKKDVEMRTAVVTVTDEADHIISNAKVTVYVNSDYANTYVDPVVGDIDEDMTREVIQYTNSGGVTTFEFERDCVFEAKVEKEYVDSTKTGGATLVFKEEAEFVKTIIIK